MADADEDDVRLAHAAAQEVDLSDETQDFRFLAALTSSDQASIPRRGEKDFEPHGTSHQAALLQASREAMHQALSITRTHHAKSHVVGRWHADRSQCAVRQARGPHFKTLGRADAEGSHWLHAEEMLYMLERGALDVRWEGDGDEGEASALPMSLQGAYAVCIGDERLGKIGLERWNVYAALKRTGFVVMRAPTWIDGEAEDESEGNASLNGGRNSGAAPLSLAQVLAGFLFRLFDKPATEQSPLGPLVSPGLYRSYNDIFRLLTIIPSSVAAEGPPKTAAPFRIAFHVWKPRPDFKKRQPGPPDYRIAVVSARDAPLPTLSQISALLATVPADPPPLHMQGKAMQRLKHGDRNMLLAVVDAGVVSYLRLSDAAFAQETMYDRFSPRGGKRSGGGGRAGRGGRSRSGARGRGSG